MFSKHFKSVPVSALTATATPRDVEYITRSLGLQDPFCHQGTVNRENITHHVLEKGSADQVGRGIGEIILNHKGQSGLIFCLTRDDCEALSQSLKRYFTSKCEFSVCISFYHAGLTQKLKSTRHMSWRNGEIHVLCTTSAFGMGIDKPDVRYVIHHTMPMSISQYMQQSGRGGRDGSPCDSYILYKYQDKKRVEQLIERSVSCKLHLEDQISDLTHMTFYCENDSTCRRVELCSHFNEFMTYECCGRTCDNWYIIPHCQCPSNSSLHYKVAPWSSLKSWI